MPMQNYPKSEQIICQNSMYTAENQTGREILLKFEAEKKIVLLKADFREAVRSKVDSLRRFGHNLLLCSSCLNFSSPVICLFLPSRPDHMCEHMKDQLHLEFTLSRYNITLSKIYRFSCRTCV